MGRGWESTAGLGAVGAQCCASWLKATCKSHFYHIEFGIHFNIGDICILLMLCPIIEELWNYTLRHVMSVEEKVKG